MPLIPGNRLASHGPMRFVDNPPGPDFSPFPTRQIFEWDRTLAMCPDPDDFLTLLTKHRVIVLMSVGVDPARVHRVNLACATAELDDEGVLAYNPRGISNTKYAVFQSGVHHVWLLQCLPRKTLAKVVGILWEDYSFDMGHSPEFKLFPWLHRRVVSYGQWRAIHLGEQIGEHMLDGFQAYEWFLGIGLVGVVPIPLYNYYQGLIAGARFLAV